MTVEEEFGQELLASLIRRAEALDRYLSQLPPDQAYPSQARTVLIKFLRGLDQAIIRRLEELRIPGFSSMSSIERTAKRLGVVLALLFELLEVVVHSDGHRVPTALVAPLEAIVRRFFPDALLLLTYDWEYNFHYDNLGEFMSRWPEYAGLKLDTTPSEHFVILGFPATEHDNVLLQAAFAHEIGHFIASAKQLENQVPATFDLALIGGVAEEERTQLFDSIERWYRELFADVFGISLFGPAYFFAFAEVGLEALDSASPDHPRPSFRLNWMLGLLRKHGYLDQSDASGKVIATGILESSLKGYLERWGPFFAGLTPIAPDPFYDSLTQAVSKALSTIEAKAAATIADKGYSSQTYQREVQPLVDRILRLVPPSEIQGQPSSAVSIVNAGWVVEAVKRDDLADLISTSTAQERAVIREIVNGLLYKAIEYTVIARLWQTP